MAKQATILICDDDQTFQLALRQALKERYTVRSAYNCDEASVIIRNSQIDILLLDVQIRTPDEGLKFIPRFHELDGSLTIVMVSGQTEFTVVREAMRLGASDYIPKDSDLNELLHALDRILEKRRLLTRHEQQDFEARSQQNRHILIGESAVIAALRKATEKLRNTKANIIINGETGTGKEVIARLLRSTLPDGTLAPFVAIDSSTIQSSMAESLLFGHEKGAFTGADATRKGMFEEADGGIIYFDEIANMPPEIQAKLLRVLQEKEIMRLGSSRIISLDFRVVCATNKDLEKQVREGSFKDDLFQRLNVIPLNIPPLRERAQDIPLLIKHFTNLLNKQQGRNINFTDCALNAFEKYSWPGNVRELSNTISYIAATSENDEIDIVDLPPKFRDIQAPSTCETPASGIHKTSDESSIAPSGERNFYQIVGKFEHELLAREYTASEGNISKLAISLGMDRSHLYTKLREHGLHDPKTHNRRSR
ncbi:MAG: sigma-54 dependent transcriptional regulator [Bdellovibrionota bacterium]